jgi:hypothetical protein
MILLFVVSLVLGLIRGGPFWAVVVGVMLNVAFTVSLIWWVRWLEKNAK